MTKFAAPLFLCLFVCALWEGVELASARPSDTRGVSVKRQIEPRYPAWAYTHGISQGYAKIAFYVDEVGEASEFLVIEYSYPAFADELMSTVLNWDFVPAMENGAPVKSVCHAYWEFLPERAVETNALFDSAKRVSGGGAGSYRELKYREEEELDARITMLAFPGLALVRGSGLLEEGRETVRARVSFFVDSMGRVALPHVLDSSDPIVNDRLEVALKGASFEVPVFKGEQTIALLERTYDFPVVWLDEEPDVSF